MSNKPPKKSDENKRWRKPRRDRGSRISPEYHLIITEGSKTEPLYFEGLKKSVNQKYTGRIEIVGLGEGANTLTILDKAEKEQLRSGGKYRHIWIVYDKDDFPEDDFDNAYFRCQELSGSSDTVTYHALWSADAVNLMICIGLMLIMLPLTVISVQKIRRKMKAKTWKNVQRWAYLFYALIPLHVIVLNYMKVMRGNNEVLVNLIIYLAVFLGYAVCRVHKWYITKKKPAQKSLP